MAYEDFNTVPSSIWDRISLSQLFFEQQGRLSRQGYWGGTLLLIFLTAPSVVLFATMGVFMEAAGFILCRDVCFFIPLFLFVYGFIALIVKRLHDLGYSGWWGLWGLVPLIGTISLFLVTYFIPGSDQSNAFGHAP